MATGLEGVAAKARNETECFATATTTFSAVYGIERVRCAVRQVLKSVVREIRTLRSKGVGAAFEVVPSTRLSTADT